MKNLVKRLQNKEEQAFKYVYEKSFKSCASYILKNSGTKDDSRDIFQEAMVVLLSKVDNPKFQLTAKVETYMYSVVRHLWLKKLEKKGRDITNLTKEGDTPDTISIDFDWSLLEENPQDQKLKVVLDILNNFDKNDCKQVLRYYYFQKLSLKEIADIMGFSSAYAKKKKRNCLKYLRNELEGKIHVAL